MQILLKSLKYLYSHRLLILSFALFLIVFLQVACETVELESGWRTREIIIDGRSTDWVGALTYIEDKNFSIGLLNDADYIYFCLVAENQNIRSQILRQGFSVWFDPEGGQEKTFGIKYPLGLEMKGLPGDERDDELDQEGRRGMLRRDMAELEILGPGKEAKERMLIREARGIQIRLAASSGLVVYELKVPLSQDENHPFAIKTTAGQSVGIGLESPKMEIGGRRSGFGTPGGERGPGVGGGPGMRGRSGGRGMMGAGGRFQMPKALKLWATVRLALEKAPSQ